MLIDSLQSGVLPLICKSAPASGGFKDWLILGKFGSYSKVADDGACLGSILPRDFIPFLSFDYERFVLSCRETLLLFGIEKTEHNLVSWPMLKAYYASFFGAHSIMRSRGAGISNLTTGQIGNLNAMLRIYDPTAALLKSGQYFFKTQPERGDSSMYSVTLKAVKTSGGVHEAFWHAFISFLETEAADAVQTLQPDSAEFVADVAKLKEALLQSVNGSGTWISSVRNQINYEHMYQTWFPTKRTAECISALTPLPSSRTANLTTPKAKAPTKAFVQTSLYVAGLAMSVGELVATRSTGARAFGQKWNRFTSLYER